MRLLRVIHAQIWSHVNYFTHVRIARSLYVAVSGASAVASDLAAAFSQLKREVSAKTIVVSKSLMFSSSAARKVNSSFGV